MRLGVLPQYHRPKLMVVSWATTSCRKLRGAAVLPAQQVMHANAAGCCCGCRWVRSILLVRVLREVGPTGCWQRGGWA